MSWLYVYSINEKWDVGLCFKCGSFVCVVVLSVFVLVWFGVFFLFGFHHPPAPALMPSDATETIKSKIQTQETPIRR